jgi:hypothetical protein
MSTMPGDRSPWDDRAPAPSRPSPLSRTMFADPNGNCQDCHRRPVGPYNSRCQECAVRVATRGAWAGDRRESP